MIYWIIVFMAILEHALCQKYEDINIETPSGGGKKKTSESGYTIESKEIIFKLKMCGDAAVNFYDEENNLNYYVQIYMQTDADAKVVFFKRDRVYEEKVQNGLQLDCNEFHTFKILWVQHNSGIWLRDITQFRPLLFWEDPVPDNYTVTEIQLSTFQNIGSWTLYKVVHSTKPFNVTCTKRHN